MFILELFIEESLEILKVKNVNVQNITGAETAEEVARMSYHVPITYVYFTFNQIFFCSKCLLISPSTLQIQVSFLLLMCKPKTALFL